MKHKRCGKLKIIKGPMFAGKSTELQRLFRIHEIASSKDPENSANLFIRHASDTRYANNASSTHDKIMLEDGANVLGAHTLIDIQGIAADCSHIFVDEAQFFPDIYESCVEWIKQGKIVTISCLDGHGNRPKKNDVNRGYDPWIDTMRLEPWAEEIVKLLAVCFKCGGPAPLTVGLEPSSGPETKVGGQDIYQASCINCCDLF